MVSTLEDAVASHHNQDRGVKRRRTFDAIFIDIEPYRKSFKRSNRNLLPLDHGSRKNVPNSDLQVAKHKDFLWMSSIKLGLDTDEEIKMWVGWNASFVTPHESPKHRIWYLPQINESPTSNAVVNETLQRSLTIAKECNKTSIAATYDLAIAIKAFRIQEQESPDYDNVFIALGTFHIQMSFFKAVGKYIAESGGPHMLIESHVLAEGSLNVFLNGKAFERCRRIHVLFAAAF